MNPEQIAADDAFFALRRGRQATQQEQQRDAAIAELNSALRRQRAATIRAWLWACGLSIGFGALAYSLGRRDGYSRGHREGFYAAPAAVEERARMEMDMAADRVVRARADLSVAEANLERSLQRGTSAQNLPKLASGQ